jgi:UDP-3-O-[3-hydroxymyristoyl] glucosamine N-acyltransferase
VIKLKDIESFLGASDIDYKKRGNLEHVAKFCSLKKVEANGLYYVVGNLSRNFEDSLILCDDSRDDFNERNTYIVVDNPQLVFYQLMNKFIENKATGVHPTAIIHNAAQVADNVSIGANSVIGNAIIGENVVVKENVVIHDNVTIGANCIISSSTVLGADGVAWIWDKKNKVRIIQPQIGGVELGENIYIGSNVTVVRGSVNENTEIGEGTLIAHGSQIGHGVTIGRDVHIANNVAIAGNANIQDRAFLGAGCVIVSQMNVAKDVVVGAGAVISRSIETEGITLVAMPARAIPSSGKRLTGVPESLEEKDK